MNRAMRGSGAHFLRTAPPVLGIQKVSGGISPGVPRRAAGSPRKEHAAALFCPAAVWCEPGVNSWTDSLAVALLRDKT